MSSHRSKRTSSVSSPSSSTTYASPSDASERASSEPTAVRSNRGGHTKAELERLSKQAVELMMRAEHDHPLLQCFSPDFKSSYNGVPANIGRDALYAHFVWLPEQYPNQRTNVTDAVADVDERRSRAKVWMTVVMTGLPGNLQKEGVSLFCWERKHGKWMCWKHVGMGGCFGYDDRQDLPVLSVLSTTQSPWLRPYA